MRHNLLRQFYRKKSLYCNFSQQHETENNIKSIVLALVPTVI